MALDAARHLAIFMERPRDQKQFSSFFELQASSNIFDFTCLDKRNPRHESVDFDAASLMKMAGHIYIHEHNAKPDSP